VDEEQQRKQQQEEATREAAKALLGKLCRECSTAQVEWFD
jgi:hypothetical protein